MVALLEQFGTVIVGLDGLVVEFLALVVDAQGKKEGDEDDTAKGVAERG